MMTTQPAAEKRKESPAPPEGLLSKKPRTEEAAVKIEDHRLGASVQSAGPTPPVPAPLASAQPAPTISSSHVIATSNATGTVSSSSSSSSQAAAQAPQPSAVAQSVPQQSTSSAATPSALPTRAGITGEIKMEDSAAAITSVKREPDDTSKGPSISTSATVAAPASSIAIGKKADAPPLIKKPVEAYAKLWGPGLEYYVRSLSVVLGRCRGKQGEKKGRHVDCGLGDHRAISRRHCRISYNFKTQSFELECYGRHGLFLNDESVSPGSPPVKLASKARIQVADQVFFFLLPKRSPDDGTKDSERSRCERPADEKPSQSIKTLIAHAILSQADKKLAVNGIYSWIMLNYPYYRMPNNNRWQNSIRHNLSMNKFFVKIARNDNSTKKGSYWTVDPGYEKLFMTSDGKLTSNPQLPSAHSHSAADPPEPAQ